MKGRSSRLFRSTYAEVNLQAIQHNYYELSKRVGAGARVMPVIKADAYGHGVVEVAQALIEMGADYFAVATLEEAMELREAGIETAILVFGAVPPLAADYILGHNITTTVWGTELIQELQEAAERHDTTTNIHVKIDTGMGRIGLRTVEQLQAVIDVLKQCPLVKMQGLYTHFACADEADKACTWRQHEQFKKFIAVVEQLPEKPLIHVCNSAGIIDTPEFAYDYVRAGISLYGYYPSTQVNRISAILEPAMTLKTHIINIKTIAISETVSYGATWMANRETIVATLPVGYADGYSRAFSNVGEVLVCGIKVPVIGRVCMDQILIDITDVADAKKGSEVVLFGRQADNQLTVEEIASKINTIPYEIVCAVSKRVPRIYT